MPADCCGQGGQQVQNTEKQKRGQIYFQKMEMGSEIFSLTLETAVGSQKSAQALGAPDKIQICLITTKGSCKNNFPWLGAETPVWQGARTAHTPRMERTSNAARQDGSTPKQGKLLLREP